MRRRWVWIATAIALVALVGACATHGMGFTSRARPGAVEETVMRAARRWGTPRAIRAQANPVALTADVLHGAMAHWADHCAGCHANDGGGHTSLGRSLYPPAPDMRAAPTQNLTDGELYYIIERGVPLTGMPAWGTGTAEGEQASWGLVLFIRHLPALTEQEIGEMEKLNPKSAVQLEQEQKINDFLKGKGRGGGQ